MNPDQVIELYPKTAYMLKVGKMSFDELLDELQARSIELGVTLDIERAETANALITGLNEQIGWVRYYIDKMIRERRFR